MRFYEWDDCVSAGLSNCQPLSAASSTSLMKFPDRRDSILRGLSEGSFDLRTSGCSASGSYSESSGDMFSPREREEPTDEPHAEADRATTPPIVPQLMDMGFSRPQINVALNRYIHNLSTL